MNLKKMLLLLTSSALILSSVSGCTSSQNVDTTSEQSALPETVESQKAEETQENA